VSVIFDAVLLEDESAGKQLIAILNEFGKKMTDIICSINFSFLDDKMQSPPATETDTSSDHHVPSKLIMLG